jgi:hypothetical protein
MAYVTAKSFLGCGTSLFGWRSAPDGRHIVTRWITFACCPLIPVDSYVIDFLKDGRVVSDHVLSIFGFDRDALEGEAIPSLCWLQVINTYLYAYLPWAIALSVGPFVPRFIGLIMASLILTSWFYAGIKMRRVFRRRPGSAGLY